MVETVELFPIKLKVAQLISLDRNKINEIISYIENSSNNDILSDDQSKSGSWSLDQNFLNQSFLADVKNECLDLVNSFAKEEQLFCENIAMSSSWFNTINKGDVIRPHVHPNSFISGVIHLTYGAPLRFFTPAPHDRYNLQTEKIINQEKDVVDFETVAGQVVLFPSTLEHSVTDHTADYPRHSIAFNTWPLIYGHDTARVNLT